MPVATVPTPPAIVAIVHLFVCCLHSNNWSSNSDISVCSCDTYAIFSAIVCPAHTAGIKTGNKNNIIRIIYTPYKNRHRIGGRGVRKITSNNDPVGLWAHAPCDITDGTPTRGEYRHKKMTHINIYEYIYRVTHCVRITMRIFSHRFDEGFSKAPNTHPCDSV